jgi:hypothetical protein
MKELLIEMMQNSAENGQPVWDWSPDFVADEILAYVDDFNESDYDAMVIAIREIQEEMNI